MALRSTEDNNFTELVRRWLEQNGEIFVVVRYSHAAGARDYLFFSSFSDFRDLVSSLPPMADIIVFRDKQLPIRGIADDALLKRALNEIKDGEEYLLTEVERVDLRSTYYTEGISHDELCSEFKDFRGKEVAAGVMPEWSRRDCEEMQSAVKPFADGSVKSGIY